MVSKFDCLSHLNLDSGDIIAIVVPYFAGRPYLKPFIDSLACQSDPLNLVVIFVDNSVNSDWTGLPIEEHNFQVIYVRTLPKIGFGRACNVGIQIANHIGADVVMVVNQDVVFDVNVMMAVTSSLRKCDGFVTPIIYDYSLNQIEGHYIKYYLSAAPECVTQHFEHNTEVSTIYETTHFSGACFAYHPSTWNRFGLFDPVYYMYGEDNDLVNRLRNRSIKFYISTDFRIGHEHGIESNSSIRTNNLSVGLLDRLKSNENILAKLIHFFVFFAKRLALITTLVFSKKIDRVSNLLKFDFRTLRGLLALYKFKHIEDRIKKTSIMDINNSSCIEIFTRGNP